jgi:threonine dehydrogenase-like Zn-dependent dehydrogenase
MRAISVAPGQRRSSRLDEVAEPPVDDGAVLVETLSIGICGTDREIVEGSYGAAPDGRERLILGHESLGRVLEAPAEAGFSHGDLVVGIVRRPDPVPCLNCAVGEWDMCRNGRYTERGIKQRDGYASERFRIEPQYAVKVPPALAGVAVLVEPTSIVAKAWEHVEHIGRRARWRPSRILVTGAGPIGLLAALLGVQRGLDVHVLDRATEGPKPQLVADVGGEYHVGTVAKACPDADVVFECTGAPQLVLDAIAGTGRGGIVCLTGLSSGHHVVDLDAAAFNRALVLENDVVFGSVNANRRHYEAATDALARADAAWLERLITRRVPLARWRDAFDHRPEDVKVVIDFR